MVSIKQVSEDKSENNKCLQFQSRSCFVLAMSASTLSGKVVLITGASSGIGAGSAKYFASLGCKLALVARSKEKLESVKQECVESGAQ